MKIINSITNKGITYINELGTEEFIDFKKCNEGWIQYKKKTDKLNNNSPVNTSMDNRYVGQRDICAKPCFIEFFTYPKFTKFEFKKTTKCLNPEELFTNLKNDIVDAGWSTLDLS